MSEEQAEVKRITLDYDAALNHSALKEQEGRILSNFSELVNKVILIDAKPFNEATYRNIKGETVNYKLTTGRKKDFLRMIKDYAVIEFDGIKCHIMAVLDKDTIEEGMRTAELQKRMDKIKHG